MPHSMCGHLQDEFSILREGFMSVAEYKVRFHKLARHNTMILCLWSMIGFDALFGD